MLFGRDLSNLVARLFYGFAQIAGCQCAGIVFHFNAVRGEIGGDFADTRQALQRGLHDATAMVGSHARHDQPRTCPGLL
ncbi:MAG: hypothetical protein RIA98_04300 [Algiphilus sp.]